VLWRNLDDDCRLDCVMKTEQDVDGKTFAKISKVEIDDNV